MNYKKIEEVHDSIINGQNKQAVEQIDNLCLYDFWESYNNYLGNIYPDDKQLVFDYFTNTVIMYHRIKNR